ncbi:UDP-N-acetylglucosamine--N-acetylmuramyl-(pentapeptide) pyrophosphoryl-undecaprenol N-acetylglucosamine transferase [Patescibacteria group bacterium]|nr:MAG: UDP-N-acetylglucosamine--N-acetylmuramyl-(pentapeptide) pyrophosphoryl-undecaprenol N-acetylglucosamine transferase [Patescibacteria group bacterium]
MKIVFTGGGTGGHFYPVIAVAEAIHEIVKEKKLLDPQLYFFGPTAFDERALYENNITFVQTPAGKIRRYFSILNFFDFFKTGWGILQTTLALYQIFPDVVFSKGGYGSVPTLLAAKWLRIPVIAHDSDAIPGRATILALPFAKQIGISYEEAYDYFPEKFRPKVALVGNPVRTELRNPAREGAQEFLELERNVPVLLFLGGSLGAEKLNNTILEALPELIDHFQVIHQAGQVHIKSVAETAHVILGKNEKRYRYKPYGYLSTLALKMAAGASDLVITRAGSGSIAEVASWKKASILIPIPEEVSRDQRSNAFAYARSGAAIVMEQQNLTPHLLLAEIERLFTNPKARNDMAEAAGKFAKPDSAKAIAQIILDTALEHEN